MSLENFWNRMEFWVKSNRESWRLTRSRISIGCVGMEFIECASFICGRRGRGWWDVPPLVPEFSSLRARRLLPNEGHRLVGEKRVQHRLSHRLSYNRSIGFCDPPRSLVKNSKTCRYSTRSTELKLDTSDGKFLIHAKCPALIRSCEYCAVLVLYTCMCEDY